MKFRPLAAFAVAATMAAGVFCFGPNPASAETKIQYGPANRSHDTVRKVDGEWGSMSYKVFAYPSMDNGFFFYPNSFVTFDVVNGKYWVLKHARMEYEVEPRNPWEHVVPMLVPQPAALNQEKVTVSFYTPDMKLLETFPQARVGHIYSVPRDGNDYERVICKIEFEGRYNQDMRMKVWDAVNPVMAEPLSADREGR